jgi:hypothetical protein
MPTSCIHIILAFALGVTGGVRAAEVYKCTDAHGGIAYQDHACASGATETLVQIEAAPALPAPEIAPAPTAETMPAPAAPAPVTETPPPKPLPPLWFCTRPEDGSHYVSRDGIVQPRFVPLGIMGYPGKSLAQAYGPGGNAMSTPELSKPPIDRSPQAAIAGDYTEIVDQCVSASAAQTCDYLRQEHDRIRAKLRNAFKDERAVLQPQQDQIEDELGGC